MRILLIRRGALGDVIVTIPLLLNLRKLFPESYIEAVGDRNYWSITLPWLVNRITDKDAAQISNLYSNYPLSFDSVEYYTGFDLIIGFVTDIANIRQKLMECGAQKLVLKEPFNNLCHMVDYTNSVLDRINPVIEKIQYPRIDFEPEELIDNSKLKVVLESHKKNVAIHPRTYGLKGLPLETYIELANHIKTNTKCAVYWVIGPAEEENTGLLENIFGTISVLKLIDLKMLAAIISQMDLYFGCDTGISHMSAATNVNSIVLFGSTNPHVWGPRGENVQILKTNKLKDLSSENLKDIIINSIDKKIGITQIKQI